MSKRTWGEVEITSDDWPGRVDGEMTSNLTGERFVVVDYGLTIMAYPPDHPEVLAARGLGWS